MSNAMEYLSRVITDEQARVDAIVEKDKNYHGDADKHLYAIRKLNQVRIFMAEEEARIIRNGLAVGEETL